MSARARRTPIRVGFLADTVTGGGGMGRYVREVLRELGGRTDIELVVVVPDDGRPALESLDLANAGAVITLRGHSQISRRFHERYRLAPELARHGVDVVHGTNQLLPWRPPMASVLTVHDLMPITWRSQFTLAKRVLLPRQFRSSLAQATMLVAVSAATARRLERLDPKLAAKSIVVPNGVGTDLLNAVPEPVPGLNGRRFALVVSDLSPRKNVGLLCDIWEQVARTTGMALVSIGPEGWRSEPTGRRLDELVRRGWAVRLRQLPDTQLRWCYEHAQVVLLPTFEEGFGLPAIEAVAFGAPVIASNDDAIVEAAQGHALHLDPNDRAAWTHAVIDAAQQPQRQSLRGQITLPSWEKHASRLLDVYRLAIDTYARGRQRRRAGSRQPS